MMIKLIHAADLHLDSPFSGLTPQQAAERRGEQRELLGRLAELARERKADAVLLSGDLGGDAKKSSGSEDFANITHVVPSLMVALAAGRPRDGYTYPAHHPKTAFDEAALPVGAAVYAHLAEIALQMQDGVQ